MGYMVLCNFFILNNLGLRVINAPPIIIPKTNIASTKPYIAEDMFNSILIK
ncbi:hypothetical protein SDC9_199801 [bioreactor metagenome]|uniref:Uncharacterized protein n=1 Tax=bioreactor metagenome TaxID=1076179 RepID=A0A645ILK5_9ZZZZ